MSIWQKRWLQRCYVIMVALVLLFVSGCAKTHPTYKVVEPDLSTLRTDHIGLLQKNGVQVIT
jgi:hypothetical protein